MSLPRVIDFEPTHVALIGDPTPTETAFALADLSRPSLTVVHQGHYLAAFGLYPIHQSAAQAWMLVNPECRYTYAKSILRLAKQELDRWQISEAFNRVQITIEFTNASFVRWSELLGFEMEGLMRKAGQDGQDHFLMARIR
jgi:hypothetical protein